jgi:hypothetical protein
MSSGMATQLRRRFDHFRHFLAKEKGRPLLAALEV